uniref:Minor tail protein n=1 Tax=Siphoviridae sp. ctiMP24 TaxID=2825621 RepID=A0A8S5P039_9CAUD|nr:MAG TPA: minor tail protein [Siphoviridae sp. ctiMP24]
MPANNDGTVLIGVDFDFDKADTSAKRITNSLGGVESKLKSIAKLAAAAFSIKVLVDLGKQAIELASDIEETQNVVETAFGNLTYMVEDFADTAIEKLGLSRLAAKQMASTYMAMGKGIGVADQASAEMAINATARVADIMSFYNLSADRANTMMKAVWTGETESFKAIGVVMTEANLQNFAYTQGIKKKIAAMTEAEKVQLRYQYVMAQTALAEGDFAKTSGSWANQVRMLSEKWKELLSILGGGLIQVLTPAIQLLNVVMSKLIAFANTLSSVFSSLFGTTKKQIAEQKQAAAVTAGAAQSTDALAKSTKKAGQEAKKAGKEAKNASAGFDTLNILSTSDSSADTSSSGSGTGGDSGAFGGGAVAEMVDPSQTESLMDEVKNKIVEKVEEIKGYLSTTFAPTFEAIKTNVLPQVENLKTTFKGIFSDVSGWGDPFLNYITDTFMPSVALRLSNLSVVAGGAFESLNMVISDLWGTAFEPFFESFITEGLPRITEFGNQVSNTFTIAFGEAKKIFDSVWTYGIMPAVELLATIFGDVWQIIKDTWDEYGQPIFDGFNQTVQTVSNLIQQIWTTVIEPIWTNLINIVTELWENHLKPLVANIAGMVAEFIIMAQTIYNNVIAPIISWVVEWAGPIIANAINNIFNVVSTFISSAIDQFNGIVTVLRGIIEFITGVFSGDWKKAWEGIKKVFKGIWDTLVAIVKTPINVIIGLINGLIDGVCSGINTVIKALNNLSFDVPDWVPVLGGKKFGFDLKTIKAPQIPKLATGAVIPPNREFLAVLGDQKRGTNIEAPLDTIVEAFQRVQNNGVNDINIKFSGNEGQLLRYLFNGLEVTKSKRGLAFVK